MGILELLLIAVGLSMDAFAVAVCTGLSSKAFRLKEAFIVGAWFGVFQAGMPIIGYFIGFKFADVITPYDHWIAFALLVFISAKMAKDCLTKQTDTHSQAGQQEADAPLKISKMLTLAFATSVDALAVGVSFAFLKVDIAPAAALIGGVTLLLSMAGVKIGSAFGLRFKAKAELAGAIILAVIGLKILLEHTGVF